MTRTQRASIEVVSGSFEPGGAIPKRHAYRGEGLNEPPEIGWSDLPPGTRELALICEDPDAGDEPWTHWLVYGIPPSVRRVAHALAGPEGVEGRNDFGEIGWGGPFPPRGHGEHRYVFRLIASDEPLGLGPGVKKAALVRALQGHVIGEGQVVGTYVR